MQTLSIALLFIFLQRPDAPPAPPVLIVTGTAQVFAAPDQATVRLGIVRQAANAQAAQEQANAVAQEILNAIGKAGVPEPDSDNEVGIVAGLCSAKSGFAGCSADCRIQRYEYSVCPIGKP